jgi:hypothetical protein
VKSLGHRRFRVFCNDNKERIAKLPGSMRKSEWVDEGAIVLIGIRELSNAMSKQGEEVADILTLASTGLYGKLKKVPGVNPLLFNQVEKEDQETLNKKIRAQEEGRPVDDDDVFDRDDESESEEEEEEEGEELTGEEKQKKKQQQREEKDKKRDQKLAAERRKKEGRDDGGGNSDVDIDAI